jgi:hypothetical protein
MATISVPGAPVSAYSINPLCCRMIDVIADWAPDLLLLQF